MPLGLPGRSRDGRDDLCVVATCMSEKSAAPLVSEACPHCKIWKTRCDNLERALNDLKARISQRTKRTIGLQTNLPLPREEAEVQVCIPSDALVMCSIGCQTHQERPVTCNTACQTNWDPCRRCHWSTPPVSTTDTGSQVFGLVRNFDASSQTQQSRLPVFDIATQTPVQSFQKRDVGCSAILEDEEHSHQRRELLAKIDDLLEEKHRLQCQALNSFRTNGKLQLQLESAAIEPPYQLGRSLETSFRQEAAKENESEVDITEMKWAKCQREEIVSARPVLHEVWAESNFTIPRVNEKLQHIRESANRIEGCAMEPPQHDCESPKRSRNFSRRGLFALRPSPPALGESLPIGFRRSGVVVQGPVVNVCGDRESNTLGAASDLRSRVTDTSHKTMSARTAHILMNTPRVVAELPMNDTSAAKRMSAATAIPTRQFNARRSI